MQFNQTQTQTIEILLVIRRKRLVEWMLGCVQVTWLPIAARPSSISEEVGEVEPPAYNTVLVLMALQQLTYKALCAESTRPDNPHQGAVVSYP